MKETIPALPVAPYIGGKRNSARRIVERIAETPHRTYVEPFVGMGGVFFRRQASAASEVINDASGDVVNLFRILQRHYVPFLEMLRYQLTSRREFERLRRTDPATLTDLERAARFLYLQRVTFGGKVAGRTFGVGLEGRPARFDITMLAPMLEAVHERLAGVTIDSLGWAECLARYDRPTTLFYLDPPYYGHEADYGAGLFEREDFARMAEQLAGLKARFLLSINDRPEIRRLFKRFRLEPIATTYTAAAQGAKPAAELLISRR